MTYPTIGIDLGGTKIYGVVLDGADVVAEHKDKTPTQGGPLAVVDAIADVVEKLGGAKAVQAVGVGAPGVVDPAAGVVQNSPNLPGWMEPFALGPALAESLNGAKVFVENDVNAGTIAEHRLGAGQNSADMLGVFVGTGVGGAVVLDGVLRRGPTGAAGEIGHMIVRPDGRQCTCGGRGHTEAYAGRAAMERRARLLDAKGQDTALVELSRAKRMTSGVFAKALSARDAVAVELLDEAVEALGVAVASTVALLDIHLVVIGGGLADRLGLTFVGRVEQAARSAMFVGGSALQVMPAALGDRGGAIGAALLANDSLKSP